MNSSEPVLPFRSFIPIYNWIYPLTARKSEIYTNELKSGVFPLIASAPIKSRALYFHIPFCDTICTFCPFVRGKYSNSGAIENYTNALIREIQVKAPLLRGDAPVAAIFFGGGTPSLLNASQITRIGNAIRDYFNLQHLREFSFEFEAKSVDEEALQALRSIGVTHGRFGLQTFNPKYRTLFALTATVDQLYRTADLLSRRFTFVSCDVIYGMHGQSVEDFIDDIGGVAGLNLSNIDFYPINNTVTQTKLHSAYKKAGIAPTGSMVKFYMNSLLRKLMEGYGYLPHNGHGYVKVPATEISRSPVVTDLYSFVYHEHVYGYLGYDVVGFGVNAITSTTRFTIFNEPNREKYTRDMVNSGDCSYIVCEHPPEVDAARPLALHLPYHGTVDLDLIDWGLVPGESKRALDDIMRKGLVETNGRDLCLTIDGWRWYVNIMHALLPPTERRVLESLITKARHRRANDFEDTTVDGHA